jgi:hypothetical protein
MHYNTLVIKFKKEYFVDLISSRLGFTAETKNLYRFFFSFLLIYWLYPKSGNADVIKGRSWCNVDQVHSFFLVESVMNYRR